MGAELVEVSIAATRLRRERGDLILLKRLGRELVEEVVERPSVIAGPLERGHRLQQLD